MLGGRSLPAEAGPGRSLELLEVIQPTVVLLPARSPQRLHYYARLQETSPTAFIEHLLSYVSPLFCSKYECHSATWASRNVFFFFPPNPHSLFLEHHIARLVGT